MPRRYGPPVGTFLNALPLSIKGPHTRTMTLGACSCSSSLSG